MQGRGQREGSVRPGVSESLSWLRCVLRAHVPKRYAAIRFGPREGPREISGTVGAEARAICTYGSIYAISPYLLGGSSRSCADIGHEALAMKSLRTLRSRFALDEMKIQTGGRGSKLRSFG